LKIREKGFAVMVGSIGIALSEVDCLKGMRSCLERKRKRKREIFMSLTSAYTYTLLSSPNGDLEDQACSEVSITSNIQVRTLHAGLPNSIRTVDYPRTSIALCLNLVVVDRMEPHRAA